MSEWILQVSDLNEYVRRTLAADPMLRAVRLRGEISNFKRHTSGHWYFTLKDERSRISCVMFRQNAMRMSLRPADGMQVIVSGSVSLYAEGGAYQFYAESMRPDGVGTLYQQFEALKARLAAEGLFDAGRKRQLPLRPRKVAVVTSPTGAVLHDIRRVSARRDPGVPLVLLPVQVQGQGAAEEIAAAIRHAGRLPGVEVIITGRGGGSMEDLWAFNDERVARAIHASEIPVVSAVGHEPDVTISDYVADLRAATPSNAAELVAPDQLKLRLHLSQMKDRLAMAMTRKLRQERQHLDTLAKSRVLQSPTGYFQERRLRLDYASQQMTAQFQSLLARKKQDFVRRAAALDAMSPLKVLGRGYSMVFDPEGGIVRRASDTAPGEKVRIQTADGRILAAVEEIQEENRDE